MFFGNASETLPPTTVDHVLIWGNLEKRAVAGSGEVGVCPTVDP